MRKAVSCIMALLLTVMSMSLGAMPLGTMAMAEAASDGMTVLSCLEEGFATKVDFDCNAEYVEGDGLYIKLSDELMPYVLVSVDYSDTRITDAEYYMNEKYAPRLIEENRANGALTSIVHGDGSINGRPTPLLELQYHNKQGYQITLFAAFDVYDGYTVFYRARYYQAGDRDRTLAAMDTVAKYLVPDADGYAAGGATAPEAPKQGNQAAKPSKGAKPSKASGSETRSDPAPQAQTSGGGRAMAFTVTEVQQGGMTMGRCTAPLGYEVTSQATCSVTEQSAGNPWLLKVAAQSPDRTTNLIYISTRDYVDDGKTQDGVFSFDYYTPALHYMTAEQYCDYYVQNMVADIRSISVAEKDDYPELRETLERKTSETMSVYRSMLAGTGVSVDKAEMSMAARRYYIENANGLKFYYCVAAVSQGVWFTASLPGVYVDITNSYTLWNLPCVYTMLCPAHQWEERGAAFEVFMENTSASDQFMLANQKLSNQLWDIITGRGTTEAERYSQEVMREETASGDDYDDERFTDYIFDQNDYTLSSGDHVKVPTAYDYVFEGADGNVYYSNSLSDQPGGSTQLYPNR